MLTADLVRVRRRGGELTLVPLNEATRARALEMAAAYLAAAHASVGRTREQLDRAWAAVPVGVRDRKLAAGLRKLLSDRCDFEVVAAKDPAELRREVFRRAARTRREGARVDASAVMAEAARALGLDPDTLAGALYADVRDAHVLRAIDAIEPAELVAAYELGQAQAVLLRATRVTAEVHDAAPETYRRLFRQLKFHRLLHEIAPLPDGGYRVDISGPYSLFRSVTKYGLQLALVLPALRACDRWSIEAEVRWGRDRSPLRFRSSGVGAGRTAARPGDHLPDEVRTLLERFEGRDTPWVARPSDEVLELPGIGLCIPDLVFEHARTGVRVYLEVLGYWSRDAVWRRVELVEQGLGYPILFAVSSRLRVSEEVLGEDLPGALYVYKGAMSAAAVEARLDRIGARDPSPLAGSEARG
ncbi:MAG: DUF790 family protein [Myxococcota bacterium]